MLDVTPWQEVGLARILALSDGEIPAAEGPGTIPVNVFIVASAGLTILVDAGFGEKWLDLEPDLVRPLGGLLTQLASHGIDPADVDIVVNTHLHVDHAGGNTDVGIDRAVMPAFPNAQYVIQAAEWAFARSPGTWSYLFRPDDYVPLDTHGRLRLIDGAIDLTSEVRCRLMAGHTPGHQVVEVNSEGASAILAGDAFPAQRFLESPMERSVGDVDPDAAAAVRTALLLRAAERDAWLGLAHVAPEPRANPAPDRS